MKIELTKHQLAVLRSTLKWGLIGNYDVLSVETDEEIRDTTKQEMKEQAKILKCLGIGWSVLQKFFLKHRSHDINGLKNFANYLGKKISIPTRRAARGFEE